MKIRSRKRQLYEFLAATAPLRRRRPRYRLTDLIANTDLIELTDEDREWLDMVPVGREFGSPDFERLTDLNPLDIDPTSNPS